MASFDSFMGGGDDLAAGHSYTTFDSFRYPHDHGLHRDHDLDLDYDHDHRLHHNLDLDDDREQSPPPLFTRSGGDGFDHFIDDDSPPLPPPTYHHSSHGNLFDGLEAAEAEEAGEEVIRTSSSSLSRSFDASPQPHQPFDVSSGLDRLSISEGNHGSFGQDGVVDGIFGFGEPYISSNGDHGSSAALLPPLEDMQMEEGFILREWRRQNAIRLAEKERLEKEKLAQIIEVADRFKEDFYIKRSTHCESSKKNNQEKEKVCLANQESFHKNADKHYWKAVGELVPHELPTAMNAKKSRGDKEKKSSTLVVVQGPKPGKPTDISRMRQILLKLKHNPPEHMKAPSPPPVSSSIEKPVKPAAAANAPVVQTLAPQPIVAS